MDALKDFLLTILVDYWYWLLAAVGGAIGAGYFNQMGADGWNATKRWFRGKSDPAPEPSFHLPHQLPADLSDFVGRADHVRDLVDHLTRSAGGAAVVTAVEGLGGVGKTALAVHVAHRLAPGFAAQVVVDLQGTREPLAPAAAMARVIQAFEPGYRPVDDVAVAAGHYRSVLAAHRTLVLLDDAGSAAQVRPLVPPPPSVALVTSRRAIGLEGAQRIDLEALAPDEAAALLDTAAGAGRLAAGERAAIAGECRFLPLALRAAGAYLRGRPDVTPAAYRERLADERQRLKALRYEDWDVAATLGLSARRLAAEDPERARRWRLLHVFPAGFEAAAAAAVWGGGDAEAAGEVLAALRDRALARFEPGDRLWRLHDLVRDVARLKASAAELTEAARRHAVYYKDVLAAANDLYKEGHDKVLAGLAVADRAWPHIVAGQAWAAATAAGDDTAARLCADYPNAGVYVIDLRLSPHQRIAWLEAGLAAARRRGDRAVEGTHLGNLGLAHAALGDARRAIEYHEQTLAVFREIGDRRGEGNALGNLGNAHADLGDARRAIEYHEQRLAIAREIGDRRGEGNALGNLGLAHAALGDARRAIEYYEQHLAIAREIGDRRGEGNALGNLGNAHADLGDARRALEYYEQRLAIAREIGDRRGEGNALYNSADELWTLNRRDEAVARARAALAIYEAIEDPHAPMVRQTLAEWTSGGG